MSMPDSISWLRGKWGELTLLMGPYRLANDPCTAMNSVAAPPDDSELDDRAESEQQRIVAVALSPAPGHPGTFV